MATNDDRAALAQQTWKVYRQDDHGNRFVVATDLTQQAAEQLVILYEQRGHKQHYWATSENGD